MSPNHRKLLVFSGHHNWAAASARNAIRPFKRVLWIGNPKDHSNSLPSAKSRQWLGRELDALVFDSHCGFDPDAFGALSGTVVGGGILILLTPPLDSWHCFDDPNKSRFTPHPFDPIKLESNFLRRFAGLIRANQDLILVEEGQSDSYHPIPSLPSPDQEKPFLLTPDQETAVEALIKVATGHSRRPLVLISDRGRGKSTALGIAAAKLLLLGKQQIIITAPRPDAVITLLKQAGQHLPGHLQHGNGIEYQQGNILFVPPDELIRNAINCDLLLVDEAAAIPTPQLEHLLRNYNRVAFATTEHGYEGTGRGFTLRFTQILHRETPHWRRLRLETPIRWAEHDPVEAFVFSSLLLNAEIPSPKLDDDAADDEYQIEKIESHKLWAKEDLLSQLFSLLVLSHYQTRPSDLRQLLDSPNLSVWVTLLNEKVVAAVLAIDEGSLDEELTSAIWRGKRRPKGHMMAQTLTNHAGFKLAATYKYCRIMRIAVHPDFSRKGIGSRLIQSVIDDAGHRGLDLVGASFGATSDLLSFWRHNEMNTVHLGVSRDAASGCHSSVVLKPLSEAGSQLHRQMRQRFSDELPLLLADPLKDLEVDIVFSLFQGTSPVTTQALGQLEPKDRDDLEAFAYGNRDYAGALLALWRLTCRRISSDKQIESLKILIIKVLQGHDWEHCSRLMQLNGKKAVITALRSAVANLLETEQ